MNYLNQLKQQADALRNEEADIYAEKARRLHFYKQHINPVMQKLGKFLFELTDNLNYVKPDVKVDLPVLPGKVLRGLKHEKYVTHVDSTENTKYVALQIHCEGSKELKFSTQLNKDAEKLTEYLFHCKINFKQKKRLDNLSDKAQALFEIQPKINAKFEFQVDIPHSKIVLSITNFDKIGVQSHVLRSEQINESFCEDLTEFIVRNKADFLVTTLDPAIKQRFQAMVREEQKKQQYELKEMEKVQAQEIKPKGFLRFR